MLFFAGLLFHVCGEAVVNVNSTRTDRQTDKENYIDFRLRLLGEPGTLRENILLLVFYCIFHVHSYHHQILLMYQRELTWHIKGEIVDKN